MSAVAPYIEPRNSAAASAADPMLPPRRNFCLCRGCGAYFLTVAAFERHRVSLQGAGSKRVCVAPPGMAGVGLALDARGYWRLPLRPMTARDKLRLRSK